MSTGRAHDILCIESIPRNGDGRSFLAAADLSRQRLGNRIQRWATHGFIQRTIRAWETGDHASLTAAIAQGRRNFLRYDRPSNAEWAEAARGVRIGELVSPAVRARWVEGPALRRDATLIYVPGGSFIAERSPRVTAMILRVAKAARMRTMICDYRLAPEHPCPAAIEDVLAALRAALDDGCEESAVGVVAESAGAAVALAAVQQMRDAGVRLGALVLFSPWTDLTLSGQSIRIRYDSGDMTFGPDAMATCARMYLLGRKADDPLASPVFGSLAGLPPMLIHTSQTDGLHDDARMLAESAARQGVPVTLRIWPSGNHVFERFYGAAADKSLADAAAFLRAHLSV